MVTHTHTVLFLGGGFLFHQAESTVKGMSMRACPVKLGQSSVWSSSAAAWPPAPQNGAGVSRLPLTLSHFMRTHCIFSGTDSVHSDPPPHPPRQAPTRERWGERLRRDTDAFHRHYTT